MFGWNAFECSRRDIVKAVPRLVSARVDLPASHAADIRRSCGLRVSPSGHYCPTGSDRPLICEPGHYARGEANKKCSVCPVRTYQPEYGAAGCLNCGRSSFCPAGSTAELSATCPPGTYVDGIFNGTDSCRACAPGSACAGGSATPQLCRPGTFAATYKRDQCSFCERGKYQDGVGATECQPCEGSLCLPILLDQFQS